MARQAALQIALSKIKLQPPDVEWVAHDSSVEKHFQERAANQVAIRLRSGQALHCAPPDFLSRAVALIKIMRFS
jgi:hypothetical protein